MRPNLSIIYEVNNFHCVGKNLFQCRILGENEKKKKYAVFEHVTLNDSLSKNHPGRERDAAVGRENARWTMSKSGRPCPCQNVTHSGLPQKILEEDRC